MFGRFVKHLRCELDVAQTCLLLTQIVAIDVADESVFIGNKVDFVLLVVALALLIVDNKTLVATMPIAAMPVDHIQWATFSLPVECVAVAQLTPTPIVKKVGCVLLNAGEEEIELEH
jgi:hypothetical protein